MLDRKQHYGHIYGNHAAAFEQAGKFFDGGGREVDASGDALETDDEEGSDAATEFLQTLLDGTAMSKKKIADEAERQGVSWHLVENASHTLNVVKFKKGVVVTWRLPEE